MIIELAGPAGCGKSTLTRSLAQADPGIRISNFPRVKEIRNLPFFLSSGLPLLPVLFALSHGSREQRLNSQQATTMAVLSGWSRLLEKQEAAGGGLILLDQGPVYMLAELLRFGPPDFRATATGWWEQTCNHWARVLDAVIALDTPDEILMKRARARSKGHGIETHSDEWASRFLARSRAAQREVLDSMGDLKVVALDTSLTPVDDTVQLILEKLDRQKGGPVAHSRPNTTPGIDLRSTQ